MRTRSAALVALSLLLAACSPFAAPPVATDPGARPRAAVRSVPVARGEITSLLTYPGELRPKDTTVVTARVAGRLERVYVEPGMLVREGDVMAELDRAALEVQALQAQAQLAGAEARLAALRAGGEDDEARAEAEALLRAARARLAALEAAPTTDSVLVLSENLRAARRRLAELQGDRPAALAQAETRLLQARGRLEELSAAPSASPTPLDAGALDRARGELRRAEQDLALARQPASAEEIAAAQQAVAAAEDALLLARAHVGQSDLDEARAQVEAAEARLRRADSAPTLPRIQAAEAAVQYAGANLELARLQLREATVVAPAAAIVLEAHQRSGAMVAVGMPLVTLQPPAYEIHVAVEERHLGQVRPGLGATVSLDAYPGESFTGMVRSVAPTLDPRTRTAPARIEVEDPRAKLKSGLVGQAAVLGDRRTGVLLVPREAVVTTPEPSVFQVLDGRARRMPVRLGLTDGRSVEIVQGLGEGMQVIANPAGLVEGDLVSEQR
jgi:multidrug efflux pump subunit AcrA (membrane-fusion protein)